MNIYRHTLAFWNEEDRDTAVEELTEQGYKVVKDSIKVAVSFRPALLFLTDQKLEQETWVSMLNRYHTSTSKFNYRLEWQHTMTFQKQEERDEALHKLRRRGFLPTPEGETTLTYFTQEAFTEKAQEITKKSFSTASHEFNKHLGQSPFIPPSGYHRVEE
jgi:hypothetical protein